MGCSPEATIYYGFPIGEPGEELGFDDDEVTEAWRRKMSPGQPEHIEDRNSTEWDEWRKLYFEWCESPQNIQIWFSGSDGYMAFYVHCDGLKKTVEWSEQLPLAGIDLGPQPECDTQIKAFCEFSGIEYKQPGWHLAALYF